MNRSESFIRALGTCAIVLLAFLFAGCETLQTSNQGAVDGAGEPVNIDINTEFRRGDKIIIGFSDAPINPSVFEQSVREDGTISLPHNQSVVAAGKTKRQLEEDIRNVYIPKFYKRMTVNIKADERFYFVTGEVRTPGQKVHTGNITAMKAIGAAGDFTDFANRSKIIVIRADGTQIKVNGKKALNDSSYDVPVYPNDRVHVDRRFM